MPKINGARRFMIFTQAHLADPQWVTPVVEFEDYEDGRQAAPIEYQDVDELERVVRDMVRARARAAGYDSGAKAVLQTFGLTAEDYYKRVKENKEKAGTAAPKEVKDGQAGLETTAGTKQDS